MVTSVQGIRGLWSYVGLCTLWITIPQVALRCFSRHSHMAFTLICFIFICFFSSFFCSRRRAASCRQGQGVNKHRQSLQGASRSLQSQATKPSSTGFTSHWEPSEGSTKYPDSSVCPPAARNGSCHCYYTCRPPWRSPRRDLPAARAYVNIPPSPPADAASQDPLRSWFAPSPPSSSPPGGTGQPPVSARGSAWGSSLPPEPCSCQLFVYPLHREKQMQFVLISPRAGCRISASHTRNIRMQW